MGSGLVGVYLKSIPLGRGLLPELEGHKGGRRPPQGDSGTSSSCPEHVCAGQVRKHQVNGSYTRDGHGGPGTWTRVPDGLCGFVKYWNEGEPDSCGWEDWGT